MGARGQGRGDEVHHHHLQAPRRVRHLPLEGLELRYHGRHAVPARRRQGACRGGASGQPQVRGLLLDHGLASPGRAGAQLSRLQLAHLEQSEFRPLCRNVYEAPAQGAAHPIPRHRRPVVRRRVDRGLERRAGPGSVQLRARDPSRPHRQQPRGTHPPGAERPQPGRTGRPGRLRHARAAGSARGAPRRRLGNVHDDDWKDTRTLVRTLIDVASKGGNFLLNVGPTADGLIPAPIVSRLSEMGEWMRRNGEAIYGTTVSPYGMPAWGRYTAKPGRVYALVFDWPKNGKLTLAGMKQKPLTARVLGDAKPLTIETDSGLAVRLPTVPPSAIASVVVLEVGGGSVGSGGSGGSNLHNLPQPPPSSTILP